MPSDVTNTIFRENEREANLYAAKCLRVIALVALVSWLLNLIGIFIIDREVANIGFPLCILSLRIIDRKN